MTRHRFINISLTLALAAAMAAILSTGHHLDDHSADWPESTALQDAQRQTQADARRERADQLVCIEVAGPGSVPARDADDRLVCRARKGGAKTVVAGGAL